MAGKTSDIEEDLRKVEEEEEEKEEDDGCDEKEGRKKKEGGRLLCWISSARGTPVTMT